MSDDQQLVRYEVEGRVAEIILDRPEKLNAVNDDMVLQLRDALHRFDADPDVWVAIFRGEGRAFSSGADVRQRQLRPREELVRLGGPQGRGANAAHVMYDTVNFKPIIAATHGYVLGAALGWALAADVLVAERGTRFQITEVGRGLSGARLWAMVADRAGTAFADDVGLTGRFFTAEEAYERGALQHLAPEGAGLDLAREQAAALLEVPPLAVRLMVRARRQRLERLDREWTAFAQPFRLHLTEDFRQSAMKFTEGVAPVYTGEY